MSVTEIHYTPSLVQAVAVPRHDFLESLDEASAKPLHVVFALHPMAPRGHGQCHECCGLIIENFKSTCAWTSAPLIQPTIPTRGDQPISGRGPVRKVGPCTMLGPRVSKIPPPVPDPYIVLYKVYTG